MRPAMLLLLGLWSCSVAKPIAESSPSPGDASYGTPPPGLGLGDASESQREPSAPRLVKPPAALACLARHYGGTPVLASSGWVLRLPDAPSIAWNDGAAKTYDEALAAPDLEDTLSIPYRAGTITPVDTPNLDPGRIRNDALFKAAFGDTEMAVRAQLVDVDFVGHEVKFHPRGAAALARVSERLKTLVTTTPALGVYVKGELGGTFSWRTIANTKRMSAHAYATAIDIVVSKSDYWEWAKASNGSFAWKNRIPQGIVDAFEAEGFAWGGRWNHFDTMHFEYRPELFDPACAL